MEFPFTFASRVIGLDYTYFMLIKSGKILLITNAMKKISQLILIEVYRFLFIINI